MCCCAFPPSSRSCVAHPIAVLILWGARVFRTHDGPKNRYISLFLHTILGPDYYVPSQNARNTKAYPDRWYVHVRVEPISVGRMCSFGGATAVPVGLPILSCCKYHNLMHAMHFPL